MKNFWTLFGYEMKKLWKRPMTWVAVLLFSAGFVYYSRIPFYNYGHTYTYTQPDGTVISREFTAAEQYRYGRSCKRGYASSTRSPPRTGAPPPRS